MTEPAKRPMHPGQAQVSAAALQAAISEQFPRHAGQSVRALPSAGTVIAPFRVGEGHLARMPLIPRDGEAERERIRAEGEHARELADVLPIEVAELVGIGAPFPGYAGVWSLWTWLPGRSLDEVLLGSPTEIDVTQLASAAAHALRVIRSLPTRGSGWNGAGRGARPLVDSAWVRTSIQRSAHLIDQGSATAIWESALAAPALAGSPVRIHGDPMPGNLIVQHGRLAGLIDVSVPVIGDPAADLQPAWTIFEEPQRSRFRELMGLDEAAWERGRGWAFEMAIGGLHYYEHSNATFFRLARRTLRALQRTA